MRLPVTTEPEIDITIRRAKPCDFDAIRANHMVTFEEHRAREPAFADTAPFIDAALARLATPISRIANAISGNATAILVAEAGGHFAGHLMIHRRRRWQIPVSVFVSDLSIRPERRGQGVATALLAALERRERARGIFLFSTAIWPGNLASQSLFKARGYALELQPKTDEAPALVTGTRATGTQAVATAWVLARSLVVFGPLGLAIGFAARLAGYHILHWLVA